MPPSPNRAPAPFPTDLLEVLVTVDVLLVVGVLQLVGLDVLPEGLDDGRAGLGVDAQQAGQARVQLELGRLRTESRPQGSPWATEGLLELQKAGGLWGNGPPSGRPIQQGQPLSPVFPTGTPGPLSPNGPSALAPGLPRGGFPGSAQGFHVLVVTNKIGCYYKQSPLAFWSGCKGPSGKAAPTPVAGSNDLLAFSFIIFGTVRWTAYKLDKYINKCCVRGCSRPCFHCNSGRRLTVTTTQKTPRATLAANTHTHP